MLQAQERCSFVGWIESSLQEPLEVGPDTSIVEKRFRDEPCEPPKFRIKVKVERLGKGQRK